ncbi:hypothetical protein Tco_0217588 [Tanacetum coccineum]
MLLTRLFKHVVSVFPELAIDHYLSFDRVMHPLAIHHERKTRLDHGKKRPRDSNASTYSTTLNHSSAPLDDVVDLNDKESQTVALNPNQILTKELSPDMKQWEELIRENVFGLGGHRDRLPACLAHMLYCVVAEEQYNLAYFFVKRIECARATPTANLPYDMFLTRLYRYVMETHPHLDNGTYDKLGDLEVIVARHVVPSLLHPLIIKARHLINTVMMMMMSVDKI